MSELIERTYRFDETQDPNTPDEEKIIIIEEKYLETRVKKIRLHEKEQELQNELQNLQQYQQYVQELSNFITDVKSNLNIKDKVEERNKGLN